jgi:hypothetical protein
MAITLRTVTGSALSYTQVDTNFSSYFYSASISGSSIFFHTTGSSTIGKLPTSTSIEVPSTSKWTDITGGIIRTSLVRISGSLNQGTGNTATGREVHVQGSTSAASGDFSHAEGFNANSIGRFSHAEGSGTTASGTGSHAEGDSSISSGRYSHAEGYQSEARANWSHAEGYTTATDGNYSHAEGDHAVATGEHSHAEGSYTQAIGDSSHAEGFYTVASGSYQHVQGQFNISSSAQSAFIIGNGTSNANRRNLVFASGSQFQVTGSLNVSGAVNTVGNLTVQGNITAQQYIVSTSVYFVTESFLSGSHIFGNSVDDTHQFTGSVLMAGPLNVNGLGTFTNGLTVTGSSTFAGPVLNVTAEGGAAGILTVTGNSPSLFLTRANGDTSIFINAGSTAFGSSGSLYYAGSQFLQIGANTRLKLATDNKERITIENNGGVIINSGSQATAPTVLQVTGSTSLSGSLYVSNDLYLEGNRQFNHGMFTYTASVPIANGVSGSVPLSTTTVADGISIVSGSRITVSNPGTYSIQFGAQLAQGAGTANFYLWFKKNGVNIANTTSVNTLPGNTNELMTVEVLDDATNTGDYYEIAHQSNSANSSLEYIAASGNFPAAPAIIVAVKQVG